MFFTNGIIGILLNIFVLLGDVHPFSRKGKHLFFVKRKEIFIQGDYYNKLRSLSYLATSEFCNPRYLDDFRDPVMKPSWFLHRNWTGTLKEHFAWSETNCVLKHQHLVNTERRAKLSSEIFLEFNWLILYLWANIVTLEKIIILSFGFILDFSNSILLSNWFLVAFNIIIDFRT